MMDGPRGLRLLRMGFDAALDRGRRIRAAALLAGSILLVLLYLRLYPLPPGWRPAGFGERIADVFRRPWLYVYYLLPAGLLMFAAWTWLANGTMRAVALAVAGGGRDRQARRGRRVPYLLAVLLVPSEVLLAGLLVWGLLQATAIPGIGWPLVVVLSPFLFLVGHRAARLLLHWLLASHLVAPAIALDDQTAFSAVSQGVAWVRARPGRIVGARLRAGLFALLWSAGSLIPEVLAVLLPGLLLERASPGTVADVELTLREGFGAVSPGADIIAACAGLIVIGAGAWLLSAPLLTLFGARTVLYLEHRLEIDGVPLSAPVRGAIREKTLEELGIELVRRIEDVDTEPARGNGNESGEE